MRARHNLPQHQILRDPQAYIRNIGKHDRANTVEAFKDDGKDTILRACIAPGEGMPLRALGYMAILEHLNRVYFPEAEAQLVMTINTADRINGPLAKGSRYESAQQFMEYTLFLPPHPYATKRPLLLFDNDILPDIDMPQLEKVLQGTPENEKLAQQASRRGADHIGYLAAHLAMHDVVASVHSVNGAPRPATTARRIISVGGLAEEPFYQARHRAKEYGIDIPGQVEQTGQLFTRHETVPAYQFGRQIAEDNPQFDPPITNPLALREELLTSLTASRSSILRDLMHVRDYVETTAAAITDFTMVAR